MGKLTYINRKIEGSKLAAVVTRDITKRLPPGSSFKAALRDPVVEFDISHKTIDDAGLQDISSALVDSITYKAEGRILILEEVSLKDNQLTVFGIAAFGAVIEAASSEIRNLDLSNNKIEINTTEEALAFERFLQSFARCTALRRLDLSGNKIGAKGYEILSKVYIREPGMIEVVNGNEASASNGLQSIPYICLANTGLDDLGATYLSHILESHSFVEKLLPLVPQAKPGAQTHQLEAYEEIKGCNGIIWKPNEVVQSLGKKVLQAAETLRGAGHHLQDQDISGLSEAIDDMDILDSPRSPTGVRDRGDSIISIDDSFHITSSHILVDLTRARSRIHLDALRNGGLQQNELWISAFRMLRYTRAILSGSELYLKPAPIANKHQSQAVPEEGSVHTQTWPNLPTKTVTEAKKPKSLRILTTNTKPRQALTVGDPNASMMVQEGSKRSGQILTLTRNTRNAVRNASKDIKLVDCLSAHTRQRYAIDYRSKLPAGFSENTWIQIIAYAADAHGVLSDNQKTSAVRWGASRDKMMEIRSLRGKHDSQQAYKALEGMECLTYGI